MSRQDELCQMHQVGHYVSTGGKEASKKALKFEIWNHHRKRDGLILYSLQVLTLKTEPTGHRMNRLSGPLEITSGPNASCMKTERNCVFFHHEILSI